MKVAIETTIAMSQGLRSPAAERLPPPRWGFRLDGLASYALQLHPTASV